jgi:hypothetical protein
LICYNRRKGSVIYMKGEEMQLRKFLIGWVGSLFLLGLTAGTDTGYAQSNQEIMEKIEKL